MKRLLILLVFVLLVYNVHGLKLSSQSCEINGEFSITLEAENKNRTYTDKIELKVDNKIVEGEWDINFIKKDPPDRRRQWATFVSKEGEVLGGGNKIISIKYPLEFEDFQSEETIQKVLECPEFHFSCALLDIRIDECYTEDNNFYGYFTAGGFDQSSFGRLSVEDDLEFNLVTTNVYEDIDDRVATKGVKPKTSIIKRVEGDKYVMIMEFPNENSVESFRVGATNVDSCLVEKYRYYHLKLSDFVECGVKEEVVEETIVEEVEVEEIVVEEVIEEEIIEEIVVEEPIQGTDNSDAISAAILLIVVIGGIIILFKVKKNFSIIRKK